MKKSMLVWSLAALMGTAVLSGCGKEAPKPPKEVTELTAEERQAEMQAALEEIERKVNDTTLSPGARREPIDHFLYRFKDFKDDPLYKQVKKKYEKMQIVP